MLLVGLFMCVFNISDCQLLTNCCNCSSEALRRRRNKRNHHNVVAVATAYPLCGGGKTIR